MRFHNIGIIAQEVQGRGTYGLVGFDPKIAWGKLPARKLYKDGTIAAFVDFRLRQRTELDALKLYFLFVARRNNETNFANLSYDKIEEYTDIPRGRIKSAVSLLAASQLVYVELFPVSMSWTELGD